MVVPAMHRSMRKMSLDRRVHIRVCGISVMHWHRLVELRERVCSRRLQRIDELSRVDWIILFNRWEKVIRGGMGLRGMNLRLMGLEFDCGLGGFQYITLCGRRDDD